MSTGTLYLIPTSLGGKPLIEELSLENLKIVKKLKGFVLETPKIGRSYLQDLGLVIRDLTFYELNENSNNDVINEVITALKDGKDIGVMSDAGAPAVGDMGTVLVKAAHNNEIRVLPLVGPSAILLAVSASGLNGQSFTFNGYLPKEQANRIKKIKQLEEISFKHKQAQVFIETPYRAQYLFEDILQACKDSTELSLSVDLTKEEGFSKTKKVGKWKSEKLNLNKHQVVFIIQS